MHRFQHFCLTCTSMKKDPAHDDRYIGAYICASVHVCCMLSPRVYRIEYFMSGIGRTSYIGVWCDGKSVTFSDTCDIMCVCMCACMHACMYACLHIHVYMCVDKYVCILFCSLYAYMCIYALRIVAIHVWGTGCIGNIYRCRCIHTQTHIHIYIYIHVHVHMDTM